MRSACPLERRQAKRLPYNASSFNEPVDSCALALIRGEMQNAILDLTDALLERLAIIRHEESRRDEAKHIARLKAVSEKIDELHARLPQPVDPRLAHYLQRKSYDKALEYLEDNCNAGL
jgi:DNA helicase TIP49 (TBP-interacting protein)